MISPDDQSRGGGFTLFELVVALAILGLALAIIVRQRPGSPGLEARRVESAVIASLREARSKAIASNRPVPLTVDLAARTVGLPGQPARQLPADTEISLLTAAGDVKSRTKGDILFEPDGSSSGGRIVLDQHGRRRAITIDWLTGRVSVGDAPH
jgi:general secretion pathway protein H